MKSPTTTIKNSTYTELDNVKKNILRKSEQLNVSIPELSKLANIPYQSLWRFMNDINIPNYDILNRIAKFLNISVAELLSPPRKDPYSVPLVELSHIQDFLNNELQVITSEFVTTDEYMNNKSFAIKIDNNNQENIYIFTPFQQLVKAIIILQNQNNGEFTLAKIFNINHEYVEFFDLINSKQQRPHKLNIGDIQVIALAVKQIIKNNLLHW